jgi:hypothetical protein
MTRIAMWSGPRNLSTAMMYSFANRTDCAVWDEPFYGPYLKATGADHPMKDAILAAHPTDAAAVARDCLGPIPDERAIFYQKHMTHHMVPQIPRDWFAGDITHVFLIRHPARVLASYARKRENPVMADLGFIEQADLFDQISALQGASPIVVDSSDVRAAPEQTLRALCDAIGIAFDLAMLSWPAGGHRSDGIWAAHWYDSVHRSTGFSGPEGPMPKVAPQFGDLYETVLAPYARLQQKAL